jgi:hypothetical protein
MSYLSDDGDDKTSSHADSLHQQACCAVRLRGWGRRGDGRACNHLHSGAEVLEGRADENGET